MLVWLGPPLHPAQSQTAVAPKPALLTASTGTVQGPASAAPVAVGFVMMATSAYSPPGSPDTGPCSCPQPIFDTHWPFWNAWVVKSSDTPFICPEASKNPKIEMAEGDVGLVLICITITPLAK